MSAGLGMGVAIAVIIGTIQNKKKTQIIIGSYDGKFKKTFS
jgi:hypothetical protein